MPELRKDIPLREEPSVVQEKPDMNREVKEGESHGRAQQATPIPADQTTVASLDDGTATAQTHTSHNPEVVAIEHILAEGIDKFFLSLNPADQKNFKVRGEQTAIKIQAIVRKTGYRLKDIVNLILNWLQTLPGVNRFYLEKEAKIKADKISHLFK